MLALLMALKRAPVTLKGFYSEKLKALMMAIHWVSCSGFHWGHEKAQKRD